MKCSSSLQRLPAGCWGLIVIRLSSNTSCYINWCSGLPPSSEYVVPCLTANFTELFFPASLLFYFFFFCPFIFSGISCALQLFNFISQLFKIHHQFYHLCVLYRATNKSSQFFLSFRWWSFVEKTTAVWSHCQCPLGAHFHTKEQPEPSEAKITPQKSVCLISNYSGLMPNFQGFAAEGRSPQGYNKSM